jgi:hypothetical protein
VRVFSSLRVRPAFTLRKGRNKDKLTSPRTGVGMAVLPHHRLSRSRCQEHCLANIRTNSGEATDKTRRSIVDFAQTGILSVKICSICPAAVGDLAEQLRQRAQNVAKALEIPPRKSRQQPAFSCLSVEIRSPSLMLSGGMSFFYSLCTCHRCTS